MVPLSAIMAPLSASVGIPRGAHDQRRFLLRLVEIRLDDPLLMKSAYGEDLAYIHHVAHLSEAGYFVTGIDVSDAMVAIAREHVPTAEFRVGSFVSADLRACVAVAAIGEVLNYAFDEGNDMRARDELFATAYQALVPNGLLILWPSGPAVWPYRISGSETAVTEHVGAELRRIVTPMAVYTATLRPCDAICARPMNVQTAPQPSGTTFESSASVA
jgi:SAM-dependent methyltransferase